MNKKKSCAISSGEGAVLTLKVPTDQAEAAAEELRERWALNPVELARPGNATVFLELYLPDRTAAEILRDQLTAIWPERRSAIREYKAQDWQEAWKHHFKPLEIGQNLRICPPWEAGKTGSERKEVVINPGLSFGTGNHFSTRFCLEMIDHLSTHPRADGFLDIGTGSGILAIAAAKLGFTGIQAMDNDPVAVEQARLNAAANEVSDQITLFSGDLFTLAAATDGQCGTVCANILSSVLIQAAGTLWALTGKALILAGIREEEADTVAEAFTALGGRESVRDGDGEWAGLLFRR
jgi:ribosomal protein L11 methyltransferase